MIFVDSVDNSAFKFNPLDKKHQDHGVEYEIAKFEGLPDHVRQRAVIDYVLEMKPRACGVLGGILFSPNKLILELKLWQEQQRQRLNETCNGSSSFVESVGKALAQRQMSNSGGLRVTEMIKMQKAIQKSYDKGAASPDRKTPPDIMESTESINLQGSKVDPTPLGPISSENSNE